MAPRPQPESQLDLFADAEAAPVPDVPVVDSSQLAASPGTHERGAVHEKTLDERGTRKSSGSYYTPPDVVEGLLDLALGPLLQERWSQGVESVSRLRILDPACGQRELSRRRWATHRRRAGRSRADGVGGRLHRVRRLSYRCRPRSRGPRNLPVHAGRRGWLGSGTCHRLHADSLLMLSAPAGRLLGEGDQPSGSR